MADNNDRIFNPYDVELVKEEAAKSNVVQGGEPPSLKCTVCVPPNCPPGYKLGKDGKCHEVID